MIATCRFWSCPPIDGERAERAPTFRGGAFALVLLLALSLGACDDARRGGSELTQPPAKRDKASTSARSSGAQPISLHALLEDALAEFASTEQLLIKQGEAARELGRMNASFQSRAYFRRIPSDVAFAGLESNLKILAQNAGLKLLRVGHRVDPRTPSTQKTLAPGEIWHPSLDELRQTIHLEIDLQGTNAQIASWINRLPAEVERLVIVSKAQPIPGGQRLFAEAYFESRLDAPKLVLRWPTVRQRLLAAGLDPNDPKLQRQPDYLALKKIVSEGRGRLPDVRSALAVVVDFPRWQLRRRFFEERSSVALKTRGEKLLSPRPPSDR